jgi:hypothetical protein
MTRITRGERILSKLVDAQALTASGHDFLVAALDPFHDVQLDNLQGWPDVETASSVIRAIKQSMSISVAAGTGPWDCHIVFFPWLNPIALSTLGRVSTNAYSSVAPGFHGGGLVAFQVPTGTALDMTSNPIIGRLYLPDEYSQGTSRIVGAGFEVINTTAQLFRQGMITTYRNSEPTRTNVSRVYYGTTANPAAIGVCGNVDMKCQPLTQARAMLIPGTRQWAAEKGCYIVIPFTGSENPPHTVDSTQPSLEFNDEAVCSDKTDATPLGVTFPTNVNTVVRFSHPGVATAASGFSSVQFPPTKIYPLHRPGAILTGLSEQTSLTVNFNVFLETFPTPAENGILVLATPSCPYDPLALEIFSHALTSMPIAVPVDQNWFGEWFMDAITEGTKFLSPLLLAAGHPELAALSAGAGFVAQNIRGYMTPPSSGQPNKPMKIKAAPKSVKAAVPKATKDARAKKKKEMQRKIAIMQTELQGL